MGNPINYIDPMGLQTYDPNKDAYGREKYDSFSGMYIPPVDRAGGAVPSGYGSPDNGHWQTEKHYGDYGISDKNEACCVGYAYTTLKWVWNSDGTKRKVAKGQRGWTDNTGLRAPDFYSLNVTVAIPNPITATVIGWSGNLSIDRHGQIFISPFGGSVGKSSLAFSASLTANWMLQSKKPTATDTYSFLSGHGISVGGGYYGGVNWAISPANSGTKNALGTGLYTPQVGASYNYTPDSFFGIPLILNKQ